MVTTNYDGRRVDYYILGDTSIKINGGPQKVNMSFDLEHGGQICTGILKQMQKAVVLLLTWMYYYDTPEWGTELPQVMQIRSITKARQVFNRVFPEAADKVLDQLRLQQSNITPYDEIITEIVLRDVQVDVDAGKLSATIQMSFASGVTTEIVLPISKL